MLVRSILKLMSRDESEILRMASSKFSRKMIRVTDALLEFTNIRILSPVQEAGYEGFVEVMKESLPMIQPSNKLIDEALFLKLEEWYNLLKEKALSGNEHSKTIFNDLAPDFERILNLQMLDN